MRRQCAYVPYRSSLPLEKVPPILDDCTERYCKQNMNRLNLPMKNDIVLWFKKAVMRHDSTINERSDAMDTEKQFLVSFLIIAKNAEISLEALLDDVLKQSYDHRLTEVILVDSLSSDRTKEIMEQFAADHADAFFGVLVLTNPGEILPCGWNVALKQARGDIILRVDAHSSIPENFIENNVRCFEKGEKITGGPRTSVADQRSALQRTLLIAESSLFGSGVAAYRREKESRYVDTLAHGAYAREIFEAVGGYDERLRRTEDNEMHYRMRQAGYKLYFSDTIRSNHHPRSSFGKMMKQKYGNGYWIGLTLGVSPRCFSKYHFIPFAFVLAIAAGIVLSCFHIVWPLAALFAAYFTADIAMTVLSVVREKFTPLFLLLPFMFFLLHLAYGAGTAVGIAKLPFWLPKNRECPAIGEVREIMKQNSAARSNDGTDE